MDVKCAFPKGFLHEEVYAEQSPGFENPDYSNSAFKLNKDLYGSKRAPRTWCERLSKFPLENALRTN